MRKSWSQMMEGFEQHDQGHPEVHQGLSDLNQLSVLNSIGSKTELAVEAALHGKPKRLDQCVKQTSKFVGEETTFLDPRGHRNNEESGDLIDESDFQESKDADWNRVEDLMKIGDSEDVELVSCSTKGFIAVLAAIIGAFQVNYTRGA